MVSRQFTFQQEMQIVERILALRKAKKIGPVLADGGKYYICESEYDPHGTKVYHSLVQLQDLADLLEGVVEKKGPTSEQGSGKHHRYGS